MKNLKHPIKFISSPYPSGVNRRSYPTSIASGLGQLSGLPAKANPLADVIGQTGPQGLQRYLSQPTQPKLTQPNFVLNPRVRKLRHAGPLLIDLLSFRRPHLGLKRCQFRGLFAPDQRSPSFRPRATLGLKRTNPTV